MEEEKEEEEEEEEGEEEEADLGSELCDNSFSMSISVLSKSTMMS